ncbi:MAG: hypothetical protein AAF458_05045 [Pseudomonadota bacterium]
MPDERYPGGPGMDPFNVWKDLDPGMMSAAFEDATRAFYDMMGRSGASTDDMTNVLGDVLKDQNSMRVVELMSRAYMTWANHGVRYWASMADRHGRYVTRLMERLNHIRSNPDATEMERRILVDEAEQYLREIADMSLQEGRVLQKELEMLSAELRASFNEHTPGDEPRRFGGVKP